MSIALDVELGVRLRKEIATLTDELKVVEERLKQAGLQRPEQHIDLVDAEREGRQWLARGEKFVVPVVFTADLLLKSFDEKSKHAARIEAATPENASWKPFYKRTVTFESVIDSGKKFRAKANELLGDAAPRFITACLARDKAGIPKSAIKVEWDSAKEVAHV